jgi:DNA mismatch repair ATPase MutS
LPLLPAILAGGAFWLVWRRRVAASLGSAARPRQELLLLAELLRLLETERFSSPALLALASRLSRSGAPASHRVRQLARLVEWNESRRNVLFAPFAALLVLASQLAFAIERWRRDVGADIASWLAAVGEFEALCSLASFAYEHPDDPFPTVVPEGPLLEAIGIGHPLLAEQRCVRNDVRLGAELRFLLISGSNMSGKSTLLRSVGVNVVLALAGATVRAHELRLSVMKVGASLRVVDSLQDGTSQFYAEITRLKQIAELTAQGTALLFLLDEILHGTNSHDRRIGAAGVIKSLVQRGGLGLVTTHDLALADIADELGPLADNVHFEDQLDGGRMVFDYRLRPGVVEKSNALDLMRGLGLDV